MNKQTGKTIQGFHAIVWQEDDLFVAKALEIELASQGATRDQALKNLEEAIDLYFQDEPKPLQSVNMFHNITIEQLTPRTRQYA